MRILAPSSETRAQMLPIAARKNVLEHQTWGFVDTSKVNADLFIAEMRAEILRQYRPSDFVVIRKESPGFSLTESQLGQLATQCDVVVFCFGD